MNPYSQQPNQQQQPRQQQRQPRQAPAAAPKQQNLLPPKGSAPQKPVYREPFLYPIILLGDKPLERIVLLVKKQLNLVSQWLKQQHECQQKLGRLEQQKKEIQTLLLPPSQRPLGRRMNTFR